MFVLGCHRSGTSLLASILIQLLKESAEASQHSTSPSTLSLQLLPPHVDNPGGFQESHQLVEFNEELFATLSIDWQHPPLHPIPWQNPKLFPQLFAARDRFSDRALNLAWVDKDPRLCITYSAYQHVLLRRIPFAAILRHPFEVASSLQARDGLPISHGLLIWFLYNQHLARVIVDEQDVLIGYEALVGNSPSAVAKLEAFLERHNLTSSSLKAVLADRVQPQWRRSSTGWPQTSLPEPEWRNLAEYCVHQYKAIRDKDYSTKALQAAFSTTPESVLCAYALHGWRPSKPPITAPDPQVKMAPAEIRADRQQFRQTTSWRLSAPLRWIGDRW